MCPGGRGGLVGGVGALGGMGYADGVEGRRKGGAYGQEAETDTADEFGDGDRGA